MTHAGERIPLTMGQALEESGVEMAWRTAFDDDIEFCGQLMMSSAAELAYDMKPIKPPSLRPGADDFRVSLADGELPSVNVVVAEYGEMNPIAGALFGERNAPKFDPDNYLAIFAEGRFDILLNFGVDAHDTVELQRSYFELAFGNSWSRWEHWVGTTNSYAYLIGHAAANLAGVATRAVVPRYPKRIRGQEMPAVIDGQPLAQYYQQSVKHAVHRVLCDEDHDSGCWDFNDLTESHHLVL